MRDSIKVEVCETSDSENWFSKFTTYVLLPREIPRTEPICIAVQGVLAAENNKGELECREPQISTYKSKPGAFPGPVRQQLREIIRRYTEGPDLSAYTELRHYLAAVENEETPRFATTTECGATLLREIACAKQKAWSSLRRETKGLEEDWQREVLRELADLINFPAGWKQIG